jgi:hypothetical protein
MRLLLGAGLAIMALTAGAARHAQGPTGIAIVDSAVVGRTEYARGLAALRTGDSAAALRALTHASNAWPTQPAYAWARAVVAARMGNEDALLDALTDHADLSVGRDLGADSAMARLTSRPAFREIAARHAELFAPLRRGQPRVVLPDSTFFPEAVDVDPRSGLFYVSSVRHRTIAELTPNGDYIRELLPREGVGLGAVLGIRVDPRRSVLWATMAGIPQMKGYVAADSATHALVRIRLPEGEVERMWRLPPSPNGHTLGDVAVSPLGDVFASDSRDPVLYRLEDGVDTLQAIRHPLFRSLQGIAPAPDGRTVFVADYSHGILRVDAISGEVSRIGDGPGTTTLGCDGLAWDDGALVAVQNGVVPPRIVRFVLDSAWSGIIRTEIIDRNVPLADEPTMGIVLGDDFVYVANSHWGKYDDDGSLLPNARLRRPVLMSVGLPR